MLQYAGASPHTHAQVFRGVLDIDSSRLQTFSEKDRHHLEQIVALLAPVSFWTQ